LSGGETCGHGDLSRRIATVVHSVGDYPAHVDDRSRADTPAKFPARGIEKLTSRVNRDSPFPVVTDLCESNVLVVVECEEIIHLIAQDNDMREFSDNLTNLELLFSRENFTGGIVGRI